jgi:hypothetical protein
MVKPYIFLGAHLASLSAAIGLHNVGMSPRPAEANAQPFADELDMDVYMLDPGYDDAKVDAYRRDRERRSMHPAHGLPFGVKTKVRKDWEELAFNELNGTERKSNRKFKRNRRG